MSSENGFIYYLPSHNYVGQTYQADDTRWKQHAYNGKTVTNAIILESNVPRQHLNASEAYYIGALGAYDKNTQYANHTRGNCLPEYFLGLGDRG